MTTTNPDPENNVGELALQRAHAIVQLSTVMSELVNEFADLKKVVVSERRRRKFDSVLVVLNWIALFCFLMACIFVGSRLIRISNDNHKSLQILNSATSSDAQKRSQSAIAKAIQSVKDEIDCADGVIEQKFMNPTNIVLPPSCHGVRPAGL